MARDYIILNGVDSRSVRGLLIQSLPNIQKPQMRTQIDEIGGRDGDVVTKLGYAAYDRVVRIGLHGDYDEEAVTKFFNTSGTAVFANEPLRVYEYAVYEPIEYDKLIRFRQADVTLHVQPFKLLNGEMPLVYQPRGTLMFSPEVVEANDVRAVGNEESCTLAGTATAAANLKIGISPVTLQPGEYTLSVFTDGDGGGTRVKLTNQAETEQFGYAVPTHDDESSVSTQAIDHTATYDAIVFNVLSGAVCNADIYCAVNEVSPVVVTNTGNVEAKPTLTISGNGSVTILVNGAAAVTVKISTGKPVTIDSSQMEAWDADGYANRRCVGDYAKLALHPGVNYIGWRGNATEIKVENYNRWV